MRGCCSTLITTTRGYGDSHVTHSCHPVATLSTIWTNHESSHIVSQRFERIRSDSFQIPVAEQALICNTTLDPSTELRNTMEACYLHLSTAHDSELLERSELCGFRNTLTLCRGLWNCSLPLEPKGYAGICQGTRHREGGGGTQALNKFFYCTVQNRWKANAND